MRETLELRVRKEYFRKIFFQNEGDDLGSVHKVVISTSDPRMEVIGSFSSRGLNVFFGWQYYRSYTEAELKAAEYLKLHIDKVFEPAGVHCGTLYDESDACRFCGAGQKRLSSLRLDLRRVTKSKDLARTFAGEWIVSQRLADLIVDQ